MGGAEVGARDAARISLNSGHSIPQLGFGVFQVEPAEAERIVLDALEVGYRHIDTATAYRNEEAVGRAIRASGIPRSEIFVTTKLFREEHGYESTLTALPQSLDRLGLDYVDLYLVHWPAPARNAYVESWRAFMELRDAGLARSIGVCNFMQEHMERLLAETPTVPAVNQIELHPAFQQRKMRSYQEPLGVVTEAWAPLGQGKYDLAALAGLREIAESHGKSVPQIVIRWHLQEGVVVFPKTVRRDRMIENADVFDFALSAEEMSTIAAADRGLRVGPHPLERN
jgi:2,5-diketo-D-gluconate reductase A